MKTVRRGYRFTDKNNTSLGIASSVIGAVSLCLFAIGVIISYKENGNAGLIVGAIGSVAFVFNCIEPSGANCKKLWSLRNIHPDPSEKYNVAKPTSDDLLQSISTFVDPPSSNNALLFSIWLCSSYRK